MSMPLPISDQISDSHWTSSRDRAPHWTPGWLWAQTFHDITSINTFSNRVFQSILSLQKKNTIIRIIFICKIFVLEIFVQISENHLHAQLMYRTAGNFHLEKFFCLLLSWANFLSGLQNFLSHVNDYVHRAYGNLY